MQARILGILLTTAPLFTHPAGAQSGFDDKDGNPPVAVHIAPVGTAVIQATPAAMRNPVTSRAALVTLATEQFPEGDTPTAVQFTPDGATIVLAHRDSQNLVLIDAVTRTFLNEIAVSGSPNALALTSDGTLAVTANVFEDTVSVIDLGTQSEVAVVAVGDQPSVVRITPDDALAVIGNTVDQSFSVIDLATRTELRRFPGAGFSSSTSITFESGVTTFKFSSFECVDSNTIIHPDYGNSTVDFFDLTTGAESSFATSAANPIGVALTPDGATAVVTHFFLPTLTVVDTAARSLAPIATGINLWDDVTVKPDGSLAVAKVQNGCVVVNLTTGAISPVLSTSHPNGLLTTADGTHALAVGFKGSLISYATQTVVKDLNNVVSAYVGAVSPAGPRAALVSQHNGEDLLVATTNGSGGILEGMVPTGAPPEADKTRRAAVSPDGRYAVTTNILSHTASVLDLTTGQLLGVVGVGLRPADVEITPDSRKAVVANLDSTFASIIDLGTLAVTSVPISTRASEVEISPDGRYAYLAVVVSDGVWRIDLNTQTVSGPLVDAGEMGGIFYLFNQASGMTLSHDGKTLITCDSFDDTITVIDTVSWSKAQTVAVGDFPARALFSADDSRLYVSHRDGSTVGVLTETAGVWAFTGSIAVGAWPFEMALSEAGDHLYVGNAQSSTVSVVDTATLGVLATIPVPDSPQGLSLDPLTRELRVACGNWSVTIGPGPRVQMARSGFLSVIDTTTNTLVSTVNTGEPPGELVAGPCHAQVFVPEPFAGGLLRDDVDVTTVRLEATPDVAAIGDTIALTTCNGVPGRLATLFVTDVGGNPTFFRLPVIGLMNAAGVWRVAGPVTAAPGPVTLTLQALTFNSSGGLVLSSPEKLTLE